MTKLNKDCRFKISIGGFEFECYEYNMERFIAKYGSVDVESAMDELERNGSVTFPDKSDNRHDVTIIQGWPETEQKAMDLGLTLQEYIDEFGHDE